MRKTRLVTAAVVCASGLLLSGCGGTVGPGVGLAVGDQSFSTARLDRATDHLCHGLEDQFKSQNTVVPKGALRSGVVQLIALRAQAEQIADEYGVSAGATYERDRAQRERTADTLPEEYRADYIDVLSTTAYANAVLDAAGKEELRRQGFDDPTTEEVSQAGTDVFDTWPASHRIEVDPVYGLEVTDGVLQPADTNLSVAVSEVATAGLEAEPGAGYTSGLVAAQRCG